MPINKRDRDRSGLLGNAAPQKTVLEVDAEIYGAIERVDMGRQVAEPISIMAILPDPAQPRRAVPSSVRAHWNGTPAGLGEMFSHWWGMARDERGLEFDLRQWVMEEEPDKEGEESPNVGSIEANLRVLVHLAASIRRDGLTNPITVARRGELYQLETGERRWLAYHLLYWLTQDEQWTRIPARVMDAVNVWRQASENAARQDLNAIGRARQYAVLLMDLWKRDEKEPRTFSPMSEFDTDRGYYAQVVGLPTPYGKGGLLLAAFHVNSFSALDRYKSLLELPDELWVKGDDSNLSERELFRLQNILQKAAGSIGENDKSFHTRKDFMRHFEKRYAKIEAREIDFALRANDKQRAQIAAQFRELADKIERANKK